MEDQQQLQPILDSVVGFTPLKTHHLFSAHLLFTLILDIVAIVYAFKHPDEGSKCKEYFIIIYFHIAYWFVTLIMHFVTKCLHNKIRLNGYFDFHKSTQVHSGVPLVVVSLWTVVLLLVQTLMQHYYPDNFLERCIKGGSFSPKFNLCAIITLECLVIAGVNSSYIVKVMKFNREKAPPDVQRSDWLASANPDTFSQNEIGYQEMGGRVYDFLEKQAELITFLKEQNARYAEKVMVLTAQLQHASSGRIN